RPRAVFRILPGRQRRRPGGQPPDGLDRGHPGDDAAVRVAAAGDDPGARAGARRPDAAARYRGPRGAPMNHPLLYQIHTRVLLQERGVALNRPATLDDVPDDLIDDSAGKGFSWVWFLGVWQTGALGRAISRSNAKMLTECRRVLPDLRESDITGSPFAVT